METVSKNPKRGRPQGIDVSIVRGLFREVKTRRGLQNVAYRVCAMGALADRDHPHPRKSEWAWIVDADACAAGKETWQPGILAELGRIEDAETIRDIAVHLCAMQPRPTVREAVKLIRRCRGKVAKRARSVGEILDILLATANGILKDFPETSPDDLLAAANLFRESARASLESNP